ncbi:MAG TPA: hypothetical protein VMW65_12190 [Chloroflexota bacterium]|nr:hypothetical protein [Chloroflexota bacterium]
MGQRNLPQQIERLHNQVDQLKQSLDQTLATFEDLTGKTSTLANEARQMVDVLGEEPQPSGGLWGLLVVVALGAGAIWLISPDTFNAIKDYFTSQTNAVSGQSSTNMGQS